MPSFNEITASFVAFYLLAVTTGHSEWIWQSISYLRKVAITESKKDWGCPSIWNSKSACSSYDSTRYK